MKRLLAVTLSTTLLVACNDPNQAASNTSADTASATTTTLSSSNSLTAEQAREYARDAYIFVYPLVLNYRTMYSQAIKGDAAFGKWLHLGTSTPADTDIVTPNIDTPYSYAWVDLRSEPWVVTLPEIEAQRYYTSQWDDLWAYVIDNPGSLNDGNGGGSFMLVAPDWQGETPEGIKRVIRGESQFLGTLTRTQLIGGQDDMPNVEKIQQAYKLQPLSEFLGQPAPAPAPAIDWPAWTEGDEKTDQFWRYADILLPFTSPNANDAAEYNKLKALGIGTGEPFDFSALDPSIQDAMRAGVQDALAEFQKAGNDPTLDSGTLFGSRERIGTDYLKRTLGVVLGIFGNANEQAVYFSIPLDSNDQPLDASKNNYSVTFPAGQIPPVKYFWSFTMYKLPQRWLVENPINRYSLSSTTPGVKSNDDGSLTIYFQRESPGPDKESNWLPSPDGPFWIVLRNYGPDKAIISGDYPKPKPVPVPIPAAK
ncbi:DUF1254 domain-containing protein [Photobacterium arenosum]|uniref:DUF1254 domain-containing protein n=1 Tax=Photobacterium arenosum TaxID=2774143 RepID=UPI00288908DA|nr:DUF1254 domain-containing protein [Photobacterium arenosum]